MQFKLGDPVIMPHRVGLSQFLSFVASLMGLLRLFFLCRLSLIWMNLGMSDMKARGYKITQRILNIFIDYAN